MILSDDKFTIGKHPLVCKFLKGVFHERPALPKYTATWDVQEVLTLVCRNGLLFEPSQSENSA